MGMLPTVVEAELLRCGGTFTISYDTATQTWTTDLFLNGTTVGTLSHLTQSSDEGIEKLTEGIVPNEGTSE